MSEFLQKEIKDYLLIMIGNIILSISLNVFFDAQQIVTGGVTGLAIILKSVSLEVFGWAIPLWIGNLLFNVPLFLIAFLVSGKNFGIRTLFSTIFLSIALNFTSNIPPITNDLLLTTIFGAVLSGIGLGMVFSAFATTGGTDLAASMLHKYFKHISVTKILFVLDGLIILAGFFIFGAEKTMYAIIAIFIITKVMDNILEGIGFSKGAFIISEHYNQISSELLVQLNRGVTALAGQGMYTNKQKNVLFCVVSKKQIVRLKEIVKNIDKDAFVIVTDVREVLGEGFKE